MKYEAVIGLEVHCQIKSRSKMFCSCPNRYGEKPNTLICPICMGYPGVMPVPNKYAIEKTIIAGLMCGCRINRYSKFDRKNYFYPDMPKNYQISQYDYPFCENGKIHIYGKGFSGNKLPDKYIGIVRIHLEEDVAKSTHHSRYSGIDFNRAGIPLMEIVSAPDIRSGDEAYAYLVALKEIMQFGNISDCDMEKGQMRCDVNISIREIGDKRLGTKIEIKNLNSFRSVHRAIDYEIYRQIVVVEDGGKLYQETRGWNDDIGETYLLRRKESANDYRYFPEPDIPPIYISEEYLNTLVKDLPRLPEDIRKEFITNYSLTDYDAKILTSEKILAEFFKKGVSFAKKPKIFANWIISELLRELSDRKIGIEEAKVAPKHLARLVNMIVDGTISGKIAKDVLTEVMDNGEDPAEIVKRKNLIQIDDINSIIELVDKAIEENPKQVEEYRSGKEKVIQYFVGQVMKLSKGKANPKITLELLRKRLKG